MKILITYDVSVAVRDSFLAAQEMQKRFPLADNIQQMALSDALLGINMHTVLDPGLVTPMGFAHGYARTLAIRQARLTDADYLVMLEADSVFLGFPTGQPQSDYELLRIFFQKEGEIITAEAIADPSRYSYASWMVLSRAVFMQPWCASDARFIGHGWEDIHFNNVLADHGVVGRESGGSAIHLWHPLRGVHSRFHLNKSMAGAL